MGYTTDFEGVLKLNKQLTVADKNFLEKFAQTRRMARNIEGFGVEGEFYVGGSEAFGQGRDDNIIDYNRPPKTQPGLWCQWVPTEDGMGIEWDGGEKFYEYVEWLEYIIANFLAPEDYVLNGTVTWRGEDHDDIGTIKVVDNVVTTSNTITTYQEEGTITVDINKVAEIMRSHGFTTHGNKEGWSDAFLDTLDALYDIETLVEEKL